MDEGTGRVYDIEKDSLAGIVDYMVEGNKKYTKDKIEYLTYLIDDLKFLRGLYINKEDKDEPN